MENKKEKTSIKEKWQNSQFKAATKLGLYGVLIIGIILYINISSAIQRPTQENNETNTTNEEENTNLLTKLDNQNYAFNINITISKDPNYNEESSTLNEELSDETSTIEEEPTITDPTEENPSPKDTIITYQGQRNKNIITVIKNNTDEYYIDDDTYYKKINDKYELTNENDLFDTIEHRYLDLDNIKEYIKKGHVEHDTTDVDKSLIIIKVPLNAIIPSHQGLEEINIEILEEENQLTLTIDYTTLMQLEDEEITNYKIIIEYSNIDSIGEINNPTLQ